MSTKLNHNNHNLKINYSINLKRSVSAILSLIIIYIQTLFPILSSYFIMSFTFSQNVYASSSVIVPDNSINIPNVNSNTHLDTTQNGTPLININSANSQGISANYYKDFNIDNKNLIINNYKGETTNTKLGGAIYGNPNFNVNNGREANIILNEITTNRITNINGYMEVAGKKADVIIANPNGIMVSGAGFINVNRLSMITGSSIDKNTNSSFNNNNTELNPFNLNNNINSFIEIKGINITDKDGNPIVYNLGVDANDLNYMDIIGRIIKINGIIAGNNNTEVNLKTGNDKAEYNNQKGFIVSSSNNNNKVDNKETDNKETKQDNNKPEFAIDFTAFGGIYAGKINFIATEDGVGVRNRTDLIATVDDINFDVNGNIIFEDESNLYSNKDINLNSKESITNKDSTISSNNDININTNNFINIGTDNIDINNDPYSATEKHTYNYDKAGTNETKIVKLETYTSKLTSNSSYLLANNNININTNNDLINHNSIIYSNNDINITTNNLNNTITEFTVQEIQHWQWKEKRKHKLKKPTYRYHNWEEYRDLLLTTSTPSRIIAKDQLIITTNEINNGVNNNNNLNSNNINNNSNTNNTNNIDNINNLLNNINHINNNLAYNLNNNLYETNNNLTNTNYLLKSKYYKDRMGGLDLYNMDSTYLRNNYFDYEAIKRELEQNSLYQNSTASLVGNSIIIRSNSKDNNKDNINNNNNTSLNNNGLIQANNSLTIENINTVNNNNKSTLRAGDTLIIDTGTEGTVNNLSGTIEINNNINNDNTNNNNNNTNNNNTIYINTGTLNNITLSEQKTVTFEEHNNKNDYQYTKITTDIGDTATIRSNNNNSNIVINTDKDINIIGGNIIADNNNINNHSNIELITNEGNINIITLQSYNYTRQYTNIDGNTFGTTTTKEDINETVNHIQSNIIASNNININSGNNLNSIGTNLESKTGDININVVNDLNLYNTLNSIYNYSYKREEQMDFTSAIVNIGAAIAITALTGGAGATVVAAGLSAAANSTNTTEGNVKITEDYDEEIVANNIISNNININVGNDANMVSTNFYNIDGTEKNIKDNDNSIYLNVGNNLTVEEAQEQHIHNKTRDEWGGDIGTSALGGVLTGTIAMVGEAMGSSMGNYFSNVIGSSNNIVNGAITGASNLTAMSIANRTSSPASIMLANGEDNIFKMFDASLENTLSKDAFKEYLVSASIGAVGGAIGGWIKETKANYTDNKVSTGESTLFDQNSPNAGWTNSKLGINSEYIKDPLDPKKNILVKATDHSVKVSYWESNQNFIFKTLNLLPGSPSFVDFHDASGFSGIINQLTIFSHYPISQFNAIYRYYPIYKQYQNIKENKE